MTCMPQNLYVESLFMIRSNGYRTESIWYNDHPGVIEGFQARKPLERQRQERIHVDVYDLPLVRRSGRDALFVAYADDPVCTIGAV